MRKLLTLLTVAALAAFPVCSFAQTDSISSSVNLDEIEIEAQRVIRKADMEIYYPSESLVKQAKNGLQLLRNMMIPTVAINEMLNTVTSAGSAVQLRINGRVATVEQVQNLLPETIKRIEWIDNPGLKYNGATSVLNFVVINPALGGSLMAQTMPALNCNWSQNNVSLKLNNGRSQFGISTNVKITENVGYHREYSQTITFPDNHQLIRNETPIDGKVCNSFGNFWIDYSYIKPDTTTFWVSIRDYSEFPQIMTNKGLMTANNDSPDMIVDDYTRKTGLTPGASIYFEQHFPKNQLIAIDMNATFYSGKSYHNYAEQYIDSPDKPVDISTDIRDCNQAYGIDANYIKNWTKSSFTAGASFNANRNRAKYLNLDGKVFRQRLDRIYFFGEYYHRFNKLSVSAGIGAQYTDFLFKDTGQGSHSWNIRPKASVAYSINNSHQLRLNLSSWQNAPSLEQTTIAPQQVDAYQWNIGNPDLKTSSSYMLNLAYNFTFPRVSGSLGINAYTSPNAITPCTSWFDDRLVSSYENSKGLSNLTFYFAPMVEVIPKWLTVSGTLRYRMERMRGSNYTLHNNNLSGNAFLMATHWNFTFVASYEKSQISLLGETKSWGETFSLIALSYNWKNFDFTAGVFCPFVKYDQGHSSVNKYLAYETHYRLDVAPLPIIQIRYKLQWGRQKRDISKIANNSASVEKSSTSAR